MSKAFKTILPILEVTGEFGYGMLNNLFISAKSFHLSLFLGVQLDSLQLSMFDKSVAKRCPYGLLDDVIV